MNLNTRIKDALKDERVVKLVEELVPNIFSYRELKLFWNRPLKFILGKGKYVGIKNERIVKLVEDIIQAPITDNFAQIKIKKRKVKSLSVSAIHNFNSYNESTIPMIIYSKGNTNRIIKQATNEYIPLVWDSNPDHSLNYKNHFISWRNLSISDNLIPNNNEGLIKTIIKAIQSNYYVYLFLNEAFIKESKRYNINYDHDYCIYGYNNSTKCFNIMGYANSKFSFFEISYDIVSIAFANQVNYSPFILQIRRKKIIHNLSKKEILEQIYEFYSPKTDNTGINIYNKLINHIENTHLIDYRYFSVINEHCFLIQTLLNKYISPEVALNYEKTIASLSKKLFAYVMKCRIKGIYNEIETTLKTKELRDAELEFAKKFL